MKIAIDCGHTLRGADTGAEGCGRKEQNCSREIGNLLFKKLKDLGQEVRIVSIDDASTLNQSLSTRVNNANSWGADLYISIHLNSGGGHGAEVFTYHGKEVPIARNVLNEICNAFGYTNRGLKGQSLYVTNHTNMTSFLIECCFIDSQSDMSKYDANKFANCICKGIMGKLPSNSGINNELEGQELLVNLKEYFVDDYYRENNPDVVKVYGTSHEGLYKHYIEYGKKEGRKPNAYPEDWNEAYYLINNPDVLANVNTGSAFTSGLHHYIIVGYKEGRSYAKPDILNGTTNEGKEKFYRVVTGSYKDRGNADEQLNKLKKAGFEGFIDVYNK